MSKSRISQQEAASLATALLSKHNERTTKAKEVLEKFLEVLVSKNIPSSVKELYKSHPNYLKATNSIYPCYQGRRYGWHSLDKEYPLPDGSIEMTDEDNKIFVQHEDTIKYLANKYNDLFDELEGVLLSLRTFKKIVEAIPEAKEYLPEQLDNMALINLESLKKRIKSV